MTKEQCEALLGARGALLVNRENRHLCRKWFTSQGFSGAFVANLTNPEMQNGYNDSSVLDSLFARMLAAKNDAADDAADDADDADDESNAEPKIKIARPVSKDSDANALATLREILGAQIDESKVRQIVDAAIEKAFEGIPALRIEVKRPDASTYNVEGYHHPLFPTLLKMASSRQLNGRHPNIMLSGPTGSGKTHACEMAAKAMGLEFRTNGAVTMDYQLIGYRDAGGTYHTTPLREAFASPAWYLFDEFDSSENSPLLCLAGALANSGFEFPDGHVSRHMDSVITAAGNTWGLGATADFVGRNKIDAAILSRFPVRLPWDYDVALEQQISGNESWAMRVQAARARARAAGLKITIDPRMTQAGAALIASGFTADDAAQYTYLANLSADQRKIVEGV